MKFQGFQARPVQVDVERERARILQKLVLLLTGLGAAAALALLASQGHGYPAAIGVCVLVTLTAFTGGGGLGFLFALPRVLSDAASAPAPTPPAGGGGGGGGGGGTPTAPVQAATTRLLQSNTNLEQLSDKLTTMLVGVSLTQLNNVPRLMWQFRLFLEETAPVFGGADGVAANAGWLPMVGCTLLVLAALAGFMAMYLYMRLVLVHLFLQVETVLHGARSPTLPMVTEQEVREVVSDTTPLETARLSPILSQDVLSVDDVLELINDALYEENFDRAIQLAESLLRTSAVNDPDYWLYRAAAFGQKHHSLLDPAVVAANPNAVAERQAARAEVLRAAREAIKLDREYRAWLWKLTNKNATDNDLQDFAGDVEFALLARPKTVRRS